MAVNQGVSKIYFVRHGECLANSVEMSLPPDEDLLTDLGREQASILGKHLANETFSAAYASNFPRARETAEAIIAEFKTTKPELEVDSRLRERDLGEYENRSMFDLWHAVFADAEQNGTKLLEYEVPGGEPVKDLEARITSFLEELFSKIRQSDSPQNILVVSHGILLLRLMLLLRRWVDEPDRGVSIAGWSFKDVVKPLKNTGYHLLSVEAPKEDTTVKLSIEMCNQVGHLEEFNKKVVPKKPSPEFVAIVGKFNEIVGQQCTTH